MSVVYTPFKTNLLMAYLVSGADIRVALLMTNTTADTEEDKAFVADFTTLDEMDGANYARKAVTSEAAASDLVNNRGEFTFDAFAWTALGAGTRNVLGALIYKHVTNDADSVPIAFVDSGGFPFTATGANVSYTPNAEGVAQAT